MCGKVLILTLNYNQNKYTIDCIDSLLKSDYPDFQILLIDNGSTDINSSELHDRLLSNPKIIFRHISPNRGYVGGINNALKEAKELKSEFILIMNNDTIVDEKAVSGLVKVCMDHKGRAIVSGKVMDYEHHDRIQYIGAKLINESILKYRLISGNEVDTGQFDKELEVDMLDDIFWLFPFRLLEEIGYYSEYFWFNSEQMDFALRARSAGYKLIYTPSATIWHKGSITQGGREFNPRIAYYSMQGSLTVRFLHLPILRFLLFYLTAIFSILSTFFKAVKNYLTGGRDLFTYSYAKLKGFLAFNKWIFTKKPNHGENPFN